MKSYLNKIDGIDDNIELMVSILIRYPEINTVKTDPKSETINFSFFFNKALDEVELTDFKAELKNSIDALLFIRDQGADIIQFKHQSYGENTFFEVIRDYKTISQGELAVLIQIIHAKFGEYLMIEHNGGFSLDDLAVQEEIIDDLLDNLQLQNQVDLIGFRESGRVKVFHKSSL